MATFETASCETLHDLHLLIDDYFTHYDGYIFRGQGDVGWGLESSLTRTIRATYPKANQTEINHLVAEHLHMFKRNIRGRCTLDLNSTSMDTLWALGQHFGLYTPLLDWSRSPYVALFFSLFGTCISGRRALWAILEADNEIIWPIDSKENCIRVVHPLGHDNQRLVNQNGLFLNIPVGKSADDLIKAARDMDWVTMYKIDYPDSIRHDLLAALNNMNINHASLFPDLIGSSLFANSQLEIQPYLEAARTKGFAGER
jgi:hypothetical protein